jgi:leucyl-tRNA synthetase
MYPFFNIERKWQAAWQQHSPYTTTNPISEADFAKPKYYCLDMFPYPSGEGLHVGHPRGYTATDILARYHHARGYHVLHAMGWDAFGLPAEKYAIKTGTHPRTTTVANIANFKTQLQRLGIGYDWGREISTIDPSYLKHTQAILKLFETGLAYEQQLPIWYDSESRTVLANEEVHEYPKAQRKMIRQWALRITQYAERLLTDLDTLDWPESIKDMQRNWIGKSSGALITFDHTTNEDCSLQVFTTRPDTIM